MRHILKHILLVALATFLTANAHAQVSLNVKHESARFCSAQYHTESGVTSIITQGRDPQIIACLPHGAVLDPALSVISFEYQSDTGISEFQIFFAPELNEKNSVRIHELKPTHDHSWSTFSLPIADIRQRISWGDINGNWYLRLDWGNDPDKRISFRNLIVRQPTKAEIASKARSDADLHYKEMLGDNITAYLNSSYSCRVTDVKVSDSHITVSGTTDGSGNYRLAEVLPYQNLTELKQFAFTGPINKRNFTVQVKRNARYDGFNYDRLLSKWVIIRQSGTSHEIASHARYASTITPKANPPEHKPFNKKGMLGIGTWPDKDGIIDIDTIHCGTLGIGITLNSFFHLTRINPDDIEFSYGGKTYFADANQVKNTDNMVSNYNQHGCHVLCYVRCYPPNLNWTDSVASRVLLHPQCNGGYQCAMNIATPEGLNAVAACLNFIGDRYSKPGRRIHVWATQNEVNANIMWCNLGDNAPEIYFTDYYTRLMRVMAYTLQQYDPNAAILADFEHNWARTSSNGSQYPARNMLSNILLSSASEGDFWWGVGAHPYPDNQPDFWAKDLPPVVTFDQSSPKVTFKNLEVLNDWALDARHFFKNTTKRPVFLCENGISSVDNSERNLTLQAAGAAYAWKKANALPGIDSFMWYSPFDYSTDFGLLLGLRYSGNDKAHPYHRKPAWFVWQAADTPREDEVFAPYLKVIGIDSWDQIFHR